VALSPSRLLTWPATLQVPGSIVADEYGDPIPGTPTSVAIMCQAFPARSDEDTVNAQVGMVEWTLYTGPDVALSETCRVVLSGGPTLEVAGPPMLMRDPRGRAASYLQAPAKVVQ